MDVSAFHLVDPEIEIQDYPGLPDAKWHHGHQGVVSWLAKLRAAFGEIHVEISNVRVSDDKTVADWEITGRGRRGGVVVSETGGLVFTFRGGKVARFELFRTRADALEAVGLSE
jgi:ketosteroid isomerase-like protein